MVKAFIDGAAGTTGLRIHDRLRELPDLSLLILPEELRKDPAARKQALNEADIVFLCLPDDAARQAVELIENDRVKVIDTSTAHRVSSGWVYGFPEIVGRETVQSAKRVANPGCHASGFIALVYPLIQAGLLSKDAALTCFSLTGYSGGGKKMIAEYESPARSALLQGPRQYALTQQHKHLPEMQAVTGLSLAPVFCPVVADFYSGMEVTVPVHRRELSGSPDDVKAAYRQFYGAYDAGIVRFSENADEGGFLSAAALSGQDGMEIAVSGNEQRLLLTARFDNLGKGASGAAIQNMNLMIGMPEKAGLIL